MSEDKGILEKTKEKLIDAKDATKEKLGDIKDKLKLADKKVKNIIDGGKEYSEQRQEEMRDPVKNLAEVDKIEGNALSFLYNEA
ncbi:hypothetical protein PVAND_017261 [Polypedilum vanderplanki]|uniref:Uncharacterized protein n=1 Tax=Polypedilum vanderplanki TaxID=319348 RepID=A0A9J6BIX8_POLVA|nr:hypothetical protein PVAND_017261 [Polypedilum vanderplanki]